MLTMFIVRMVTPKGEVVHGQFRAELDMEKAIETAKAAFPGNKMLAVYPKNQSLRAEWARQYWFKGVLDR